MDPAARVEGTSIERRTGWATHIEDVAPEELMRRMEELQIHA
jgi:hypothetical protein